MKPIFIGGCPRSGTTLLSALLGAHSQCIAVPESQFKIECLRPQGMPTRPDEVEATLSKILSDWRFRAWGIVPDDAESGRPDTFDSYAAMVEWLVQEYANQHGHAEMVQTWIDHTPDNVYNLTTLLEAFTDAKAVHIIRDGRAVAASMMPLDWGPNTARGAGHYWVENVSYGLAAESILNQDRITQVRYEDLVSSPEQVLEWLCSWLGLNFEESMTRGDGFVKPAYYSYRAHRLVGKKPDSSRANAWETELKARDIEAFESVTGDFLQYLGYELRFGLKTRKTSGRDIIQSMASELVGEIVNRARGRWRIRAKVPSKKSSPRPKQLR